MYKRLLMLIDAAISYVEQAEGVSSTWAIEWKARKDCTVASAERQAHQAQQEGRKYLELVCAAAVWCAKMQEDSPSPKASCEVRAVACLAQLFTKVVENW